VIASRRRVFPLDVDGYLASVERCRARFPGLRILSGIEAGEPHHFAGSVAAVLKQGQFDRVLKFTSNFLGETGGAKKTRTGGLLSVDPSQPQVIDTVIGRESDSFFTGRNSRVPRAQFEMSAAQQVVGFRRGSGPDLLLQSLECLIYAAGREKSFGGVNGERQR